MFEKLHIAAQAMIWVSIIDAAGFAVITLILVRAIREQGERYHSIHRDQLDVLIKLLARADKTENHAASRSPEAVKSDADAE